MDTVEVETSPAGTTLLLDRQLRRAPVVDRRPVRPVPDARSRRRWRWASPAPSSRWSRCGGPIDISTVEELRRELWSASRGGALPLTVDLGAVTHLASAGIQVLFDFVEEMTADGRKLRFVVPPGCPARHAVALTALDRVVVVLDA